MSSSLTLFAPQPGAPGVPAASRTGVLVSGLLNLLKTAEPPIEVATEWLGSPPREEGALAATRRSAGELRSLLQDRSRYSLLLYPQVPALGREPDAGVSTLARRAYHTLRARSLLTRRRVIVFVHELPVDKAVGLAVADGRAATTAAKATHEIERALFRAAHRLVVPAGFVQPIQQRYGIDNSRFCTFRRQPYLPEPSPIPVDEPPIEFERGAVNFFYSGTVDSHVAANFRAILKSIRNAPQTRLHVCGPGRDAVREWLADLDAPNVRHYGQLGIGEHDWLARRCDVGLVLYPAEDPYAHLRPTLKYSAYLANGLAVLATDLRCVSENVREDGVGLAMPIRELELELLRWATRPKLWKDAKARAEQLAPETRSGSDMQAWIQEIAAGL
jgi:glycosyltransferase involved in cell wall biosynthesis